MEIILIKDYTHLGYEGDICKVKDGYARNYLIPKKIAVVKNSATLRTLEQMKKSLEKKHAKRIMEAEVLKGKIKEIELTIPMKVTDSGKLYGSVSQQVIVDILTEKGIEVAKRDVHIEHPIKEVGKYQVQVKLYHSIDVYVNVSVTDIDKKEEVEKVEDVVVDTQDINQEEIEAY